MHQTLALAAFVGSALALTSPPSGTPSGYQTTYPSKFQITNVQLAKRDLALEKRAACPTDPSALVISLNNGVLTNQQGYQADVVANYQFQFDPAPGQAGFIYNAGFSIAPNMTLAIGDTTVFYQCNSGSFSNLYTQSIASYCIPINLAIEPCGDGSSGPTGIVSQTTDGQPQVTSPATQKTDGQPNVPTTIRTMISQISDGQPQLPTNSPITMISDGQPQAPTGTPITMKTDGQPNGPTGTPITQKTDGQPNGPTGTPITQKTDGQPNGPTGTPITQKTDGQPNAPTGTPISQIGDGQPQANNTAPSVVTVSGGNALVGSSVFAIVAALVATLL